MLPEELTIRDYIATQAMSSLISTLKESDVALLFNDKKTLEVLAIGAYIVADQMLLEKAKLNNNSQ